ncbi:MAG: ComEC/Rec2 family competence protein [Flavicella sp.]
MKRQLYYIPLHLVLAYSLGLFFVYYTDIRFPIYPIVFLVLSGLVLLRFYVRLIYVLWTTAFCWGMLVMLLYLLPRVSGIGEAKYHKLQLLSSLYTNSDISAYRAKLLVDTSHLYSETIELHIQKDSTNTLSKEYLLPGDEIEGFGSLHEIQTSKNPFGFDYKNYLRSQNIHRSLYFKKGRWKLLASKSFVPRRSVYQLQQYLIQRLQITIDDPQVLGFSLAFLLGERGYISKELKTDFKKVGLMHVLAISGLHIGILILLLRFIGRPLSVFKHAKLIEFVVINLFLILYAMITGLSASVLRAVSMYVFVAIGLLWKNQIPLLNAVIASALLLTSIDPFCVFSIGFQLSYVAVLSIVIIQPKLLSYWQPKHPILNYFWQLTTVSIAAQLGVLPLSLYYFHQFSGLFLLSNLLVMPFVGIVFSWGLFLLMLSLFECTPRFFVDAYCYLIRKLHDLIYFLGKNNSLLYESVYFSEVLVFTSYLCIMAFTVFLYFKSSKAVKIFFISILLLQTTCYYEKNKRIKLEQLVVFHEYKNSLIVHSKGGISKAWGGFSERSQQNLKNYCVALGHDIPKINSELPMVFGLGSKIVLRVDATGIYKLPYLEDPYILLTDTPKINLERLLLILCPKAIIADGTNTKFYRQKWAATCAKYGVKFYDTYTNGAFIL